ncbi:MAG: ELM1/GtrOC1 family putative glycosyltransferase [Pseudomonadota bacterium]
MLENPPASMKSAGKTTWVLAAPGAGDNHQLRALASLVSDDIRWFEAFDGVPRVLIDRLRPGAAKTMQADKKERFSPPWPNLVLIAGGRSVIDALRIRHASHGHSRIVCIGRPWAPLGWFDLVVTTPQYQLPESDSVLCLPLPLNLPDAETDAEHPVILSEWLDLPRPWLGVLLGGDSGSYQFTQNAAISIADQLNSYTRSTGGSALVISSPRTPGAALTALESQLQPAGVVHRWQAPQQPSLLPAVLQHADSLWVTSDSASMLAEAIYSAKQVSLLELPRRLRSRLLRWMRKRALPGKTIKQKLVERGLWLPARDLNLLHERLRHQGLLSDLNHAAQPELNKVNQQLQQDHEKLRRRISRLFE